MSGGLETGGAAAPDPGPCRAGSSRQLRIYAPSPQHLPLPPRRGTSAPTSWHPASRQLGGLHVNRSHHSKTQGPALQQGRAGRPAPCPSPSCRGHPVPPPPCSSCHHRPHCYGHPAAWGPALGTFPKWVPGSGVTPEPMGIPGWVSLGVGVPGVGAWVSGRAGCGSCPAPGAASKGQRLGMRQLFPEPRGLPKKAPGVYFWALSDSPLAGCWGLCHTCRGHPHPIRRICSCPRTAVSHSPPGAAGAPGSPTSPPEPAPAPPWGACRAHARPQGWLAGSRVLSSAGTSRVWAGHREAFPGLAGGSGNGQAELSPAGKS